MFSLLIISIIIGFIILWQSSRKRGIHVFPYVTPIARESLLLEGRTVKGLPEGRYEVDIRGAEIIPIEDLHNSLLGWHYRTKSNTYTYRWSTNSLDLGSPSADAYRSLRKPTLSSRPTCVRSRHAASRPSTKPLHRGSGQKGKDVVKQKYYKTEKKKRSW
jgi:hypothetical protein